MKKMAAALLALALVLSACGGDEEGTGASDGQSGSSGVSQSSSSEQESMSTSQSESDSGVTDGTSAQGGDGTSSDASESGHSDGSSAVGGSSSVSDETGSDSPLSDGSSAAEVTQKEAEEAVAKAAGWKREFVYADTFDDGDYYSIELRENHKAQGEGDPNTAPVIGYFRYYKESGKIMKMDMVSGEYEEMD